MSHIALGVEGAIISTENPGHLIPGFRVGGGQQGYAGIICTCPNVLVPSLGAIISVRSLGENVSETKSILEG